MQEATVTVCHVLVPLALVLGAIRPDLYTIALAKPTLGPLAAVDGAIVQPHWSLLEHWLSRAYFPLAQALGRTAIGNASVRQVDLERP